VLVAAYPVRPAGDRTDPQRPLRTAAEPLRPVAPDRRRGRGGIDRQILLHIFPGDAGYGSALLGYHYYTWALIGFVAAIILLAAILLFDRQFDDGAAQVSSAGGFAQAAVWLVIALTALNVVSSLLECGFGACADNPTIYELLKLPA
jgi:disulfide bond formation protein DsbB